MGLQYHLLQPETSTGINGAFREFQTIDFVLNGDGRKLVKNSIVLTFQLRAYSDAYTTRVTTAQAIGIEPKIGGHAFIGSYTTEVQSAGIVESIQEVRRYVNTV